MHDIETNSVQTDFTLLDAHTLHTHDMEGGCRHGSAKNSRMTKTENEAMTSLKNRRKFFDIFLQIVEFTGLPSKQFYH